MFSPVSFVKFVFHISLMLRPHPDRWDGDSRLGQEAGGSIGDAVTGVGRGVMIRGVREVRVS